MQEINSWAKISDYYHFDDILLIELLYKTETITAYMGR